MNDNILVEQTLAGDHQAFNGLITDYYTDIYGMILSWVKEPEDAKDLTQDVFISAYLDLPSLNDRNRFYWWLRQIAKHKCQNWRRKQIDFVPLHDDLISKEPSSDKVLILRETLAKVMEAIDNLPESEKILLKEHYLDDISYDELEAKHGVSAKALVMRLVRARRKIRDQLEKTLSAFVAFLHDHTESILTGGTEIVKLSVKTKLIAGGIAVIFLLGGAGVSINRYYVQNKSEKETLQASQEGYLKSPVKSVSDAESSSMNDRDHSNKKVVAQVKMQVDEPEISKEKTENLQSKVASGTENSKTDANKTTISPELESAFKVYKDYIDKIRNLSKESDPFDDRYNELCQRDMELGEAIKVATEEDEKSKLRKELQQVEKEKGEVAALKAPFLEERDRLTEEMIKYIQAHLEITFMEFEEGTYHVVYETWAKEQ